MRKRATNPHDAPHPTPLPVRTGRGSRPSLLHRSTRTEHGSSLGMTGGVTRVLDALWPPPDFAIARTARWLIRATGRAVSRAPTLSLPRNPRVKPGEGGNPLVAASPGGRPSRRLD